MAPFYLGSSKNIFIENSLTRVFSTLGGDAFFAIDYVSLPLENEVEGIFSMLTYMTLFCFWL